MISEVTRGVRWVGAVLVVLALAAAGCSDDDDGDDEARGTTTTSSSTTTSTTSTTSTSTTSTSTTAPPSTATTATTAVAFPKDAPEYSGELVRAWGVGDRATAEQYASPQAVDTLFAFADPGGPRWDLQRCEGAAGTAYCTYLDPERHMVVDLAIPVADDPEARIDHPHEVARAEFHPA